MADSTARGVPIPTATDPSDIQTAIGPVANWLNNNPGVATLTAAVRTGLTGAAAWAGRTIFETDTGRLMLNTAAGWRRVVTEETADGAWRTYTIPAGVGIVEGGGVYRVAGKTCTARVAFMMNPDGSSASFPLPVPASANGWTGGAPPALIISTHDIAGVAFLSNSVAQSMRVSASGSTATIHPDGRPWGNGTAFVRVVVTYEIA
jgi:hypothetical protein